MNPGSKLLFYFVDILEGLDFYFYHSINQKILSTDRKQVNLHRFEEYNVVNIGIFAMFL